MVELPRTLLKDFAGLSTGVVKDGTNAKYVRGTVKVVGEKKYVLIDGASTTTPIAEVVDVDEGDRVLVSIQNHTATILGNFTFPPSARKEQEAIDKAEDAQQNANQANENMNAAFEAAQSAKDNADKAMADATEASSIAANAKEEAADALLAAQTAGQNATEAKNQAAQAASDASTAVSEAAKAQSAVANANAEMDKINKDVETVKGSVQDAITQVGQQASEMETIKSTLQTEYAKKTEVSEVEASLSSEITQKVGELQATVEQNYAGKTDLTTLEGKLQTQITQNAEGLTSQATKIEKIESDTTEAKKDVDEALEKAGLAQTAASAAQTAASAAQTAADQAKANAATADSKAQAAQTAADAAQAKAEAADKAVQTAQSDLDEAKKNLTSVTSRVDATEEEIAEAQQKVDEAQTAVNTALADAAEANLAAANAQTAANQAKDDAATAQQAATTAQNKADNAQAAADKAQEDATEALKDVAALTSRVTAAETSITQNAEQIALTASKTEEIGEKADATATNLANNYYSKTETDAKIQVESDRITQTVSKVETVETALSDLEIGGRNLIIAATCLSQTWYGSDNAIAILSNAYATDYISIDSSSEYTLSGFEVTTPSGPYSRINTFTEDKVFIESIANNDGFPQTYKFDSNVAYVRISIKNDGGTYSNSHKFEKGNKATDWTPAPEDMATTGDIENVQESITGIDERVTESESEIEQLANSISMMVTDENGQSLMEQTSEGWTFNIGAIQSQIDEATDGLDTVEKNLNSTTDMVNKANDLLDDVTQKTAYINMATDDSGSPCIELGKQGNPFKLRITNTSIDFMQDNMRIAYITNRQLYIEKSVVTDEMKVGSASGFIWKKRTNGNMGLRWVGE